MPQSLDGLLYVPANNFPAAAPASFPSTPRCFTRLQTSYRFPYSRIQRNKRAKGLGVVDGILQDKSCEFADVGHLSVLGIESSARDTGMSTDNYDDLSKEEFIRRLNDLKKLWTGEYFAKRRKSGKLRLLRLSKVASCYRRLLLHPLLLLPAASFLLRFFNGFPC